MSGKEQDHQSKPGGNFGLFAEWGIVLAICAITLFVIIPTGTSDSVNFGLSPKMVPTVTVSAIAFFAVLGFVTDWRNKTVRESPSQSGIGQVLLLICASCLGIALIHFLGLVGGGTILLLLCSLALGEMRAPQLLMMGTIALGLLLLVEWSGL